MAGATPVTLAQMKLTYDCGAAIGALVECASEEEFVDGISARRQRIVAFLDAVSEGKGARFSKDTLSFGYRHRWSKTFLIFTYEEGSYLEPSLREMKAYLHTVRKEVAGILSAQPAEYLDCYELGYQLERTRHVVGTKRGPSDDLSGGLYAHVFSLLRRANQFGIGTSSPFGDVKAFLFSLFSSVEALSPGESLGDEDQQTVRELVRVLHGKMTEVLIPRVMLGELGTFRQRDNVMIFSNVTGAQIAVGSQIWQTMHSEATKQREDEKGGQHGVEDREGPE